MKKKCYEKKNQNSEKKNDKISKLTYYQIKFLAQF